MTPRSSCPGGESTPLRGATSGSYYEINNVTETAVGISRGRHPERGYGLSYSPPGSFLESTGGSVLTRAEGEIVFNRDTPMNLTLYDQHFSLTETDPGWHRTFTGIGSVRLLRPTGSG